MLTKLEPAPDGAQPPVGSEAGIHGEVLTDGSGRSFTCAEEALSNRRVWEAARAGAEVAVDPCGCGGDCGLIWLNGEDVRDLVRAGPPTHNRKRAEFSLWRAVDGVTCLVGVGDIRWGSLRT